MKIVMMNGGLGNQVFQYIFFRYMEIITGDICYIDDRYFFSSKTHSGYELERVFGLKPKKLSEFFDADDWNSMVELTKKEINVVDYLRAAGLDIQVLSEGGLYAYDHRNHNNPYCGACVVIPMNGYEPNVTRMEGNLYCYGYFINVGWFAAIKNILLEDLRFPEFTDEKNMRTKEEILQTNSIGIHVRRGDFVELGRGIDPAWYVEAIKEMKRLVESPVFFIFSDDICWCRENLSALGFSEGDDIHFVENNSGENNFRDMQLMTYTRGLIIANSSFSYLAALLNRNPNKLIINPISHRGMV